MKKISSLVFGVLLASTFSFGSVKRTVLTCTGDLDESSYSLSVTTGSHILSLSENGIPVSTAYADPFKNETEYGFASNVKNRVRISINHLQSHELAFPYVHATMYIWLDDATKYESIYFPVICNTKP